MKPAVSSNFRFGKFLLLGKIGSGGMSEVYLAKLTGPEGYEKRVALKLLLPHLAYDEEFIKMLADEALIVSNLDHPNIVQVFEFGRVEERYYLCMEYVDGPNLGEFMKEIPQIPREVCIFILAEILKGLHYAHSAKDESGLPLQIVHRDISPQNILIRRDGVVKVTDFGIAKARGRLTLTRPGFIKGKYRYMSPEQVEGRGVDFKSDLFSLGVIAYELASGRKLFDGETEMEIVRKIREIQPENVIVNEKWFEVFKRCLFKEKIMRPSSAEEIRKVLLEEFQEEYIKGEEMIKVMLQNWNSSACRVKSSTSSTVTKPVRKRTFLYNLFLVVSTFLLISLGFIYYFFNLNKGTEAEVRAKDRSGEARKSTVQKEKIRMTERKFPEKAEGTKGRYEKKQSEEGFGYLTLHTEPWTHVFIDGKDTKLTTPLVNVKLKAGKHTLRCLNEFYSIDEVIHIRIKKNKRLKVKRIFRMREKIKR